MTTTQPDPHDLGSLVPEETIVLSPEKWDQFLDLLDEEPRPMPKLTALLRAEPKPQVPVQIMGQFIAFFDPNTGTIERWTFTPYGGDAGYFGPAAMEMSQNITILAADEPTLDVDECDSPFWLAVQNKLAEYDGKMGVDWTEDGPSMPD